MELEKFDLEKAKADNKWTPEPWQLDCIGCMSDGSIILSAIDAKHAVECVNALAGVENPKEYLETILNQREELAEQVDLLQKGLESCMKQRNELAEQVKELTTSLNWATDTIIDLRQKSKKL